MPEERPPARRREPIVPFLLVDGDLGGYAVLQAVANDLHCHILPAAAEADALRRVREEDFAAVLLVVSSPSEPRLDFAHQLQVLTAGRTPLVFIIRSEAATEFPCEQAFRLGAADCFILPLVEEIARARLAVFAERFRLIAEQRQIVAELRRANQSKDQFLAVLAHELRNPLGPMLNGLHLLRLAGADRNVAERAREMMERQVRHMARLVDDLLDVSRIPRGKLKLQNEMLDLARLVKTTTEDRRTLLEQGGLRLVLHVPQTPVRIVGDQTRLAQVVANLLDNAIKFTQRGNQIMVTVSVDLDARQAVLVIADEGIGIEPHSLPRVFDVFAQADRSLERESSGLGLGLALVKGLTELHGGAVSASSAGRGQGAEFTVRLPLQPEPAAVTDDAAGAELSEQRRRVLIIEDNRDAADMLRLVLQIQGHDVRTAHSGPEGVRLAGEWRPEVILCDIGLPGLDGYAVAAALRSNPATSRARLVAITGYGGEENRRRALEAGFDQHLTKPVSPDQLQETLVERRPDPRRGTRTLRVPSRTFREEAAAGPAEWS